MKDAFETTDTAFLEDTPVFKINELGLPEREIKVDLESKDISLFWESKERTVLIGLGLCSIVFLSFLFGGV